MHCLLFFLINLLCLTSVSALVNGKRASSPYIGEMNREDGGLCTATLIADRYALTAAHCLRFNQKVSFRLDGQDYEVTKQIAHPNYKKEDWTTARVAVDLALLKINMTKNGTRMSRDIPKFGDPITIYGYGINARGGIYDHLQSVRLAVTGNPGRLQIRLKGEGGGCMGDSGGPAINDKGEIVGVISWTTGEGRATCGLLTGLTPLAPHLSWLMREIKK